jgi:hypothetical protein
VVNILKINIIGRTLLICPFLFDNFCDFWTAKFKNKQMDIAVYKAVFTLILVTVPTALIGGGMYLIVRAFVRRDQELRVLEVRAAAGRDTHMLRLQSYERMVLFLERISPGAVIARVLNPDMINHELQLAMIRDIRSEFEHNLTQQLYISSDAWQLIVSAKDEIIKAIGLIASHMPADTGGQQVARVILESIDKSGQMLPNQTALEYLKNEARGLM